ncbi:hypothetical protein GCM10009539_66010 [Cryptosporangium japonicum]|uniref:Uncharacterized protein n=1 Tax=Cryptosporangium japonicum TaxID=80872 RepID=A0ABP3EM92_9ACTN
MGQLVGPRLELGIGRAALPEDQGVAVGHEIDGMFYEVCHGEDHGIKLEQVPVDHNGQRRLPPIA